LDAGDGENLSFSLCAEIVDGLSYAVVGLAPADLAVRIRSNVPWNTNRPCAALRLRNCFIVFGGPCAELI